MASINHKEGTPREYKKFLELINQKIREFERAFFEAGYDYKGTAIFDTDGIFVGVEFIPIKKYHEDALERIGIKNGPN